MAKQNKQQQSSDKLKNTVATETTTKQFGGLMPVFICLGITAMVFANTLSNKFVNWDDDKNFYENPYVQNFTSEFFVKNTIEIFSQPVIGNYNPLSIFSLAIDKVIYGFDNPGGWHFTNLLLHLICVFFVYRIVIALGLNWKGAFITALLFGIHPMRVESVAWITERKDVLFGAFYLPALWLYIKQKKYPTTKRTFLIFLLFGLSLLSKIQAVMLPLSMLMVDYYLDGKLTYKNFLSKLPFFILSLVIGIVGLFALAHEGSIEAADNAYPTYTRPFIGSYSLLIYLIKSVIPFRMSPLYPYPTTMPSWFYLTVIVYFLFAWFIWKKYKEGERVWVFGLGFFFVNVFMLLQILGAGQGFIADRFTYIPYLGIFFIIGYYASKYLEVPSKKMMTTGLLLVGTLAFAGMTIKQNTVWKDSENLWTHVLKYYQQVTLPWGNRANFRRSEGRILEALADYNKAISLQPSAQTYNSRARLYFDVSSSPDTLQLALSDYEKAIELDPKNGEFYSNRGATYARLGNLAKALEDFNKALEFNPNNKDGYLNRSVLYYNTGQNDLALADMLSYLKIDPFNADLWFETGRIYASKGNWTDAMTNLNKAIAIDASQGIYFYQRCLVFINMNNDAQAKQDALMAIQLGYPSVAPDVKQRLGIPQ
ncbi:MAG: tetratricopeptide repeat protein [Saprospiraceae bacterium]|nr:tetratricopeptide repeat protein [Saprospiraceae bacterium]MBP7642870.1 tetratricopeptide repeat protein [Saprospiraceae bacterium]